MKKTLLSALLASAFLMSCGAPFDGFSCTEIGCSDQLTLVFQNESGSPVTDLAGELQFDDQTVSFDCSSPDGGGLYYCNENRLILSAAPAELTIAAVGEHQEAYATINVTYETSRPNGEDCPPECQHATHTVNTNARSEDAGT